MKFALVLVFGMALSMCQTLETDYRTYDRSHTRRVDVSYDSDSQTWDLGYTITPITPVSGYSK